MWGSLRLLFAIAVTVVEVIIMGIDDCRSHGHMYRVRCVLVLVSLQVGILVAVFQQLALDIARSRDPDVYYDAVSSFMQ